jgi:hypothetical protein
MNKKKLLTILIVFSILFVSCTSDIEKIDTTSPSEVTGMIANSGNSFVELTWINPSDIDFEHVEIIATPTDITEDTVTVETVDNTINSYTVRGLTNDKEYTFIIKAIDMTGNKCAGCNSVTATPADTIATSEVTNLTALVVSTDTVILTWNNPTDSDFDHVEIIATPTVPTVDTGTVKNETSAIATETYTVTGLTNGKEYTFVIKAIDTSGNTSEGCVGVTATPSDKTAPSEVKILIATKTNSNTIKITWTIPTDRDFDHFEITIACTNQKNLTFSAHNNWMYLSYLTRGIYTFYVTTVDTSGNKSKVCVSLPISID